MQGALSETGNFPWITIIISVAVAVVFWHLLRLSFYQGNIYSLSSNLNGRNRECLCLECVMLIDSRCTIFLNALNDIHVPDVHINWDQHWDI